MRISQNVLSKLLYIDKVKYHMEYRENVRRIYVLNTVVQPQNTPDRVASFILYFLMTTIASS